ncbi:MAG TPA: SDR family oxidoreductase [bacterium]|nr:SDR family oxidoreductase [bacterium]
MAPSVALVTGCSTGIGYETALGLARQGHQVFATMRDLKKAVPLRAAAKGLRLEILPLDVDRTVSVRKAVGRILRKTGRIDILVNNAGWGAFGALEEFTDAEIRAQFETNVFGLLRVTQAVLPAMRAQGGGKILQIGSLAGRMTFAGIGLYCASKHAVEGVTESLRLEVRPFGVQVAVLEPGTIRTPFKANRRKALAFREERSLYQRTLEGILWFGDHPPASAPGPEVVAREAVRILSKERLAIRYRVGRDAVWYPRLRWFLPDFVFDQILRKRYEGFRRANP